MHAGPSCGSANLAGMTICMSTNRRAGSPAAGCAKCPAAAVAVAACPASTHLFYAVLHPHGEDELRVAPSAEHASDDGIAGPVGAQQRSTHTGWRNTQRRLRHINACMGKARANSATSTTGAGLVA
jgi:hypothetical protein